MASSYASIASNAASTVVGPNYSRGTISELQKDITQILGVLQTVTTTPDSLVRMMEILRNDMEIPQSSTRGRFGGGSGSGSGAGGGFSQASPPNWRGTRFQGNSAPFGARNNDSFGNRSPVTPSPKAVGRYQSKFTTGGNMNDKILNTVIGNKLNSFTATTYNDTRDFIYQIMDSGETEFIKDFIEKVFSKATVEELYCALFAKLIAEIAHRYPIMYEEMKRYHQEFLNVFEDVDDGKVIDSDMAIRRRLYRLGYGQFISELACNKALEKEQLIAMVSKVMDKVWELTVLDEKVKVVEEFIDCLVRLTKSLVQKSPEFFEMVKGDMAASILERAQGLISKTVGARPSLSTKAKFGLMDLKDLL
jgi:hypothetical protein